MSVTSGFVIRPHFRGPEKRSWRYPNRSWQFAFGRLPSCDSSATITLWHFDAGSGRRPPHQKLFFEPRLSGYGTVACATCHDPDRAFTDGRPVSVGIHGRVGQRNAPTVLNALYNKHQLL